LLVVHLGQMLVLSAGANANNAHNNNMTRLHVTVGPSPFIASSGIEREVLVGGVGLLFIS